MLKVVCLAVCNAIFLGRITEKWFRLQAGRVLWDRHAGQTLHWMSSRTSPARSVAILAMRTDHVEPKALFKLWEPYAKDKDFDWGFKAYSKCRRSQAADVIHMEPHAT